MDNAETHERKLEVMLAARTRELAFAQAQLGVLFRNSPLAIGTATMDGEILTANATMAKMFGYEESEFIGTSISDFFPDLDQRAEIMGRLQAEEVVRSLRQKLRRKDGTLFYANVTESILKREGQEVILGVVDDISAQMAAEQVLHEKAEADAVAAERNRIANELHDSLIQTLYSASLIAEALPKVLQKHPEEAMRSLDELRALTQGAQAEMRSLLLELRPGEIADRKLGELMRQLTEAMMARTHMPISLTTAGDCQLPVDVQVAFYRITQEALNNIYKHAQAGRAWVNLRCSPEGVTVRVTDDGRGINTTTGLVHQMGLKIMHERAAAIGANLTIRNREEQGTEVMADWQATG